MKKVGLLLKGKSAKLFLEKLLNEYHSSNFYTIITQDHTLIPQAYPQNFTFYHFDPTSPSKIQKAFLSEPDLLFLIYDDIEEGQIIYQTLRSLFPQTQIFSHTPLPCTNQDDHLLEEISSSLLVSNTLLKHLPNIPSPIQDIGLGKGEIMEILVPPASVYCYRTLGSISQKEWRIVGIYRGEELLLGSYSLSIQPNDKLLAIGNPKILNNVYRQITSSLGQFPIPFGKDLFLYLDEDMLDENEILHDLDEALFLHKHLNCNQLMIYILNAKTFSLIEHIKSIQDANINVVICYKSQSLAEILKLHHQKRIGLAILNHKIFHLAEIKKTLFELSIPTFKTAQTSIQSCTSSLVLLEEENNIASITLDIASQLKLDFEIYDFEVDGNYRTQSYENYKNLSQIFAKPIHLIQSNTKNPIIHLAELKKPVLQFLPFDSVVIHGMFLSIASTNPTYHCINHNKNPQILVPLSYAND